MIKPQSSPPPLHPDLEPWLIAPEDGAASVLGLPMLKHPLVFSVPYTPLLNEQYNKMLQHKTLRCAAALEAGDWHEYVFLHERPYRVHALHNLLRDDELPASYLTSKLIMEVWTDTENSHQSREQWRELLLRAAPYAMSDEQREELPEKLRIFRGIDAAHDERDAPQGFSWTTDRDRARWFALRLTQNSRINAKVWMGSVAREHVLFTSNARNEAEVVVLPEHVTQLSIKRVNV